MADGFLGRWARRKHEAAQGKALDETVKPSPLPSSAGGRGSESAHSGDSAVGQAAMLRIKESELVSHPLAPAGEGRGEGGAHKPLPTLEDVKSLTQQSDFTPFMTHGVAPEVKNAAMKKLFADPRYNVMDRLDIYIDDYSQPDPLPLAMLRQMSSAKFLNLFEDDPKTQTPTPLRDNANPTDTAAAAGASSEASAAVEPACQTGESGAPKADDTLPTIENHANTDLRLQQDDAAGTSGSGRSA